MGIHHDIHRHITRSISDHQEWVKGKFDEIARKEHTPHEVALGFSIGIFVSLATPGFDFLVALLVILIFRNINKLSVFIGVAIINPLTMLFIYPLSFKIGTQIIAYQPVEHGSTFSVSNIFNISKYVLVGNIVLAVILGIVSYFAVYWLYYAFHYRRIHGRKGLPE